VNADIRVKPSFSDAVAGTWMALGSQPRMLAFGLGFFVVLPWGLAVLSLVLGLDRGKVPMLVVLPFAALAMFGVGIPLLSYAAARRSPAFGEAVHRIDDDGINTSGKGWNRTVQWSTITGCNSWRGAILLRSGNQALFYFPARSLTPELATWIHARVRRPA
jgi:hypothetical protein